MRRTFLETNKTLLREFFAVCEAIDKKASERDRLRLIYWVAQHFQNLKPNLYEEVTGGIFVAWRIDLMDLLKHIVGLNKHDYLEEIYQDILEFINN